MREPWSLLCDELFCVQFFLSASTSVSVICGDCINLDLSHYHQNPVRLRTSSTPSPLSFSFRARGYALPFEKVCESNHRHLSFSTQICQTRRLDACLLGLTREALESTILVDLDSHLLLPRRHACFQLSWHDISCGTRFGNRGWFRHTGNGVTPCVGWSQGHWV